LEGPASDKVTLARAIAYIPSPQENTAPNRSPTIITHYHILRAEPKPYNPTPESPNRT